MSGTNPSLSQRAAQSIRHPLSQALLALTFTTGVVDGVSYLGLGHVFAANMTGNIVLLAFGIAGGSGLPVVAPLVSLFAFLAGAGTGGVLATRLSDTHHIHMGSALLIEAGLLAAATVLAAAVHIEPGKLAAYALIAVLAFAMGVRNATVRRIGVPDLTTTVLTLTLTGLAAESPLAGGSGKGSARRIAAVLAMLLGALVGALTRKISLVVPLAIALAMALATWLIYIPAARREGTRTSRTEGIG
jgi:uncharacterized membrane protein YoaK (UPF0700 family)